jgi:hypothetical protein
MRKLRAVLVRLVGMFRKERRERELAQELESHLQFHIEDNLRAGMTPEQARRQALISLGGLERTKERWGEHSCRESQAGRDGEVILSHGYGKESLPPIRQLWAKP